jgi:hypothetical protein
MDVSPTKSICSKEKGMKKRGQILPPEHQKNLKTTGKTEKRRI